MENNEMVGNQYILRYNNDHYLSHIYIFYRVPLCIGPASRSLEYKGEGIDPARPGPYDYTCFADGTQFEQEIFV